MLNNERTPSSQRDTIDSDPDSSAFYPNVRIHGTDYIARLKKLAVSEGFSFVCLKLELYAELQGNFWVL